MDYRNCTQPTPCQQPQGGGSPSPPPAPDYVGAANATAQGNMQAAQQAQRANMVNQNTPYGSLSYTQDASSRFGPDGGPSYSANIALSPTGQALLDNQNATALGLGGAINNSLGRVQGQMGSGMDMSNVPGIKSGVTPGTMPTAGDLAVFQQAQDNAYKQATARLDPQWNQRQGMTENALVNQGLRPGTEAYDNAMRDFNTGRNDAYGQAYGNAYGQGLAAQNQAFGQGLSAEGQAFNQGATNVGLNNQAAQQQIQQNAFLRSLPLNELNALRTGAQVTNPQFSATPQQQTPQGANLLGAAQASGQYGQGLYNQQVGQQNEMMSGLFGLGSAAAGATSKPWWMG